MKDVEAKDLPPCSWMTDLFFGPDLDGRNEIGRAEREEGCKNICITHCPYLVKCLHRAMLHREYWGVWGGMGEADRRDFRAHMKEEGYDHVPEEEDEFTATYLSFYRSRDGDEVPRWKSA